MDVSPAAGSSVQFPDRLIGSLLELSNLVGSVMRVEDILQRIVEVTAGLMDVPVCSLYLLQEDGRLVMRSNVGFDPAPRNLVVYGPGEGIPGWVAQNGELVRVTDATEDARYSGYPHKWEEDCRAYLCAPLRIQDEVIGVMTARRREAVSFSFEEVAFFETACKQVAIVLEKARLYDEKLEAERLAAVAVSLSGVAHYIKNVMFASDVGGYQIESGLKAGDLTRVRRGWEALRGANGRIRKLVENMLSFTRKRELQREPVDINALIGEIVDDLEPRAKRRGTALRCELDDDLGVMELESDAVHDALLNLVTNAIDAIHPGAEGVVTIRTAAMRDQRTMRVDVIDTGTGIPADVRDKIFNLFFSTKGERGTGIGLSATRKIIESHGGSISVESEVGRGCRFTVHLPVVRSEDETRPEDVQSDVRRKGAGSGIQDAADA